MYCCGDALVLKDRPKENISVSLYIFIIILNCTYLYNHSLFCALSAKTDKIKKKFLKSFLCRRVITLKSMKSPVPCLVAIYHSHQGYLYSFQRGSAQHCSRHRSCKHFSFRTVTCLVQFVLEVKKTPA